VYEPAASTHAHFRCTGCGAITDLEYAVPAQNRPPARRTPRPGRESEREAGDVHRPAARTAARLRPPRRTPLDQRGCPIIPLRVTSAAKLGLRSRPPYPTVRCGKHRGSAPRRCCPNTTISTVRPPTAVPANSASTPPRVRATTPRAVIGGALVPRGEGPSSAKRIGTRQSVQTMTLFGAPGSFADGRAASPAPQCVRSNADSRERRVAVGEQPTRESRSSEPGACESARAPFARLRVNEKSLDHRRRVPLPSSCRHVRGRRRETFTRVRCPRRRLVDVTVASHRGRWSSSIPAPKYDAYKVGAHAAVRVGVRAPDVRIRDTAP